MLLKICFLSALHTPLDKRVFDKEAVSLAQHGFHVVHVAPDDEIRSWQQSGVTIQTFKKPAGMRGRLLQLRRLYRLALEQQADCYHCNEVDSWLVGLVLKLAHGAKVVFDVHEHYPSEFPVGRFPRWSHPAVGALIRLLFKVLTPFTDRIVFAKRTVAVDFKGSERRQVLVQNFARLSYGSTAREHHTRPAIRIVHLGLISRLRGWPQLLDAMSMAQCQEIHLHLVGAFYDGSEAAFAERVRELGLSERVTVEKWLPFEDAYLRLVTADVGLVLFQPGLQNHVWALPHKLFDYMLSGLPVIAPDFAEEVADIVREADGGLLVDPKDPISIAGALDRLASDSAERRRLGANGRNAVIRKFNWEIEAAKLVKMYREMSVDI